MLCRLADALANFRRKGVMFTDANPHVHFDGTTAKRFASFAKNDPRISAMSAWWMGSARGQPPGAGPAVLFLGGNVPSRSDAGVVIRTNALKYERAGGVSTIRNATGGIAAQYQNR